MEINGIKGLEDSLLDYPGQPAVIVYFGGCGFRCGFCHNVELVTGDGPPDMPWRRVVEEIKSRVNLIEAVVASGGEPTLNQGLSDFLAMIKEMDFLTKLDTNGSRPEVLRRLLAEGLVDYVAMDIKQVLDPQRYAAAVGGHDFHPADISESIALLRSGEADYEFRTTVVPGVHTAADIAAIARELRGARRYVLQNFVARARHVDPAFVARRAFDIVELRAMAAACSRYLPTSVRGK